MANLLARIDRQGYRRYKELRGEWALSGCRLTIDHVQGDPFAAPSRVRVHVPAARASFPDWAVQTGPRALGLASHLAVSFAAAATSRRQPSGSGKSGEIRMEAPGQQVLAQSAVRIHSGGEIEARFTVGLPGHGRRVAGNAAKRLLLGDVPRLVDETLLASGHDTGELRAVVETNEDAEALRDALDGLGLAAFVADGASLPRRSGIDDRPLPAERAVPFESPPSLRVAIETPNSGAVTGMGIPTGVTLIVGGGYHGKSTLLRALERGVYNHRPGDGRERTVTDPSAAKIRAEDGRAVTGVDISAFIGELPDGTDTARFSTENASGSTSQAAAISEALEAGARALLVDEDTAATNFMIRDRRMQALVPGENEPITPFVDRVRELWRFRGVSSILVVGGSGDYLEVADTVVAMRHYRAGDVSAEAARIVSEFPTGRLRESSRSVRSLPLREPDPRSVDPRRGRRDVSVKVRGPDRLEFGTCEIDLAGVEQLVCRGQIRAIGDALVLARSFMGEGVSVQEVLDRVMGRIEASGLDALDPRRVGDLVAFRRHELAAALNRLRGLRVRVRGA